MQDIKTGFTDSRRKTNQTPLTTAKELIDRINDGKDERSGMSVEYVAKVMYKNIMKRPPLRKVSGC